MSRRRRGLRLLNKSPKKLRKLVRSYLKERCKQHKRMKEESSKLDLLLKGDRIDENTYERLQELLEMSYKQKSQEIRLKYGFA
jgi:hypothetical protein